LREALDAKDRPYGEPLKREMEEFHGLIWRDIGRDVCSGLIKVENLAGPT